MSYDELERREEIEHADHCWHVRELLRERAVQRRSVKGLKAGVAAAVLASCSALGAMLVQRMASRWSVTPAAPVTNPAEVMGADRVQRPPAGQHAP